MCLNLSHDEISTAMSHLLYIKHSALLICEKTHSSKLFEFVFQRSYAEMSQESSKFGT